MQRKMQKYYNGDEYTDVYKELERIVTKKGTNKLSTLEAIEDVAPLYSLSDMTPLQMFEKLELLGCVKLSADRKIITVKDMPTF